MERLRSLLNLFGGRKAAEVVPLETQPAIEPVVENVAVSETKEGGVQAERTAGISSEVTLSDETISAMRRAGYGKGSPAAREYGEKPDNQPFLVWDD